MIKNEESRIDAIQSLSLRVEHTQKFLESLRIGTDNVQIDANAVANLILHSVLNQTVMMGVLSDMLLKEGETVGKLPEADIEERTEK